MSNNGLQSLVRTSNIETEDPKALAVLQECLIITLFKAWHLIGTLKMQKAVTTIKRLTDLGIAGDSMLFAYLFAATGQAQLFLNPNTACKDFQMAERHHSVPEHKMLLDIAKYLAAGRDLPPELRRRISTPMAVNSHVRALDG